MPTRDLARRLTRLEEVMWPPTSWPMVIRINGGLPGGDAHASAGPLHFSREPGESQDVFESRVIAAAAEAGYSFTVFGGLPPLTTQSGQLVP
jgi:hypothetical protein